MGGRALYGGWGGVEMGAGAVPSLHCERWQEVGGLISPLPIPSHYLGSEPIGPNPGQLMRARGRLLPLLAGSRAGQMRSLAHQQVPGKGPDHLLRRSIRRDH